MGRGRKWSNDKPMAPPIDLLGEVEKMQKGGEGPAAAEQGATSFCSMQNVVPFRAHEGATVSVGDAVRLRVDDPPAVIVGDDVVAEVTEPHAKAMRACLAMGFRMSGTVLSLDEATRMGTLSIAGERVQAA